MRKFSKLVNDDDYDAIINEWRALPFFYNNQTFKIPNGVLVYKVKRGKSVDGNYVGLFPLVSKLMMNLLTLPHSSAASS